TGAVDETATGSANFFGPPTLTRLLDYDRRDAVSASPSASTEHRSRRDRADLGRRTGRLHLLRAARRRGQRRDGDRAWSGRVRRDLVPRALARRGNSAAPAHTPTLVTGPLTPRSAWVDAASVRRRACA